MVSAAELQDRLSQSSFWLYPSTFPETSCTVAVKAMCAGAVPITIGWPLTALPEIVGQYDAGLRAEQVLARKGWIPGGTTATEQPYNRSIEDEFARQDRNSSGQGNNQSWSARSLGPVADVRLARL